MLRQVNQAVLPNLDYEIEKYVRSQGEIIRLRADWNGNKCASRTKECRICSFLWVILWISGFML